MKNAVLILAGGTSKRIGQDKASLEYNGKTFLDILIESFNDADIAIASNDERHHRDGCVLLADKPGFVGPLAGILSGIEYFKRDHIFVVSVDTPFVNQMVMKSLQPSENDQITVAGINNRQIYTIGWYPKDLPNSVSSDMALKSYEEQMRFIDVGNFSDLCIGVNTQEDFNNLSKTKIIELKVFGQLQERLGFSERTFALPGFNNREEITNYFKKHFKQLDSITFQIAINQSLSDETNPELITEIALFPPFSGG